MNDKQFIKSVKKDLDLIYSNLHKLDGNELDLLLYSAIYRADEQLNSDKIKKKPKNKVDAEMIEPRIYPKDYIQRAKYMLKRLTYHYHFYKIACDYYKKTQKLRYLGIPKFEFWSIREDMAFYKLLLKGELKEFQSIFEEHYVNKLSLMDYAEKYYGERSAKNKKRAEYLNKRFCDALAKALELRDAADAQNKVEKIKNAEFEEYKLLRELDVQSPRKP